MRNTIIATIADRNRLLWRSRALYCHVRSRRPGVHKGSQAQGHRGGARAGHRGRRSPVVECPRMAVTFIYALKGGRVFHHRSLCQKNPLRGYYPFTPHCFQERERERGGGLVVRAFWGRPAKPCKKNCTVPSAKIAVVWVRQL